MQGWRLNQSFNQVRKPITYIGAERNIVKKSPEGKIRIALCFPETYALGMSNLGYKILYHLFNRQKDVYAERCFAPQSDMEEILTASNEPLFTLETKTPLKEFNLIAFSLDYELNITNILNMLSISGIPILSERRKENDPIVMVGGTVAYNPAPIQRFIDVFAVGDGEILIDKIIGILREKLSRAEVLNAFNENDGFYVPSISPKKRVKRQITEELLMEDFPVNQIVPYTDIIHNRYIIEISRGCTRGCRFCQSGYIYRPTRERKLEDIVSIAKEGVKNTGWDEISLLSFSTGDHSKFYELLYALKKALPDIGISLPSLRADVISDNVAKFLSPSISGITIAAEAGTERLRKIINKDITENDIFRTAETARKFGWRHIKVYFMIGLPGENEEDIQGIIDLSKRLSKIVKETLIIKISPFVPRPHTPFQWERQHLPEEIKEKGDFLFRELRGIKKIRIKMRSPYISTVEGIIARGDERIGDVIQYVFENGARLEGWKEFFNFGRYAEGIERSGYTLDAILRERGEDEKLPWYVVDIGIDRDFLRKERERAKNGYILKDCRLSSCTLCGMCPGNIAGELAKKRHIIPLPPIIIEKKGDKKRFRVYFSKTGEMRFLSHLDTMRLFLFSGRSAGIEFVYRGKYNKRPRISFGPALPVGLESEGEIFDIYAYKMVSDQEWNRKLPDGIRIKKIREIPLDYPNIMKNRVILVYQGLLSEEKYSNIDKKLLDIKKSVSYIKRENNIIEVGISGNQISLISEIFNSFCISEYRRKGLYRIQNGIMEEV